jgi:hypothetical protein
VPKAVRVDREDLGELMNKEHMEKVMKKEDAVEVQVDVKRVEKMSQKEGQVV